LRESSEIQTDILAKVSPDEARAAVLAYDAKHGINCSKLSRQIGEESRDAVRSWVKRGHRPRDPQIWVKMAITLGLFDPSDRMKELARDLAVEVLEKSKDPSLTQKAVLVVKEALASYGRPANNP